MVYKWLKIRRGSSQVDLSPIQLHHYHADLPLLQAIPLSASAPYENKSRSLVTDFRDPGIALDKLK